MAYRPEIVLAYVQLRRAVMDPTEGTVPAEPKGLIGHAASKASVAGTVRPIPSTRRPDPARRPRGYGPCGITRAATSSRRPKKPLWS